MAKKAKDQTPKETLEEKETPEETPKETAEEKETPPEEKTPEEKVDYETKFKASQKEAMRLLSQVEELKAKKPAEAPDLDKIIDQKIRARMAPLEAQQTKDTVDGFLKDNPEAMDYLEKINDLLPESYGKTISEKLENAFLVAKKDSMREAGKKEMAFALYEKEQVVASGGGASASKPEGALPPLTAEEKEIARKQGVSEEIFAKRKSEVERGIVEDTITKK